MQRRQTVRLNWQELEPGFALRAWERQRAIQAERRERPTQGTLEPGWSVFSLAIAVLLVALYLNLFLHLTNAAGLLFLTLCPAILCFVVFAPLHLAGAPRGRVEPDALRAFLQDAGTTPTERVYGETLLLLLETHLAPGTARSLLRQVHGLAAEEARLARQGCRLEESLPGALIRAEEEQEALLRRLEAEPDAIARRSLAEGAALCAERLENLRALPRLQARLQAHRERIGQALELAHSALLYARTTEMALDPPEVDALRQAARAATERARALEETALDMLNRI